MIIFALFAKVYAMKSGMHPKEDKMSEFLSKITLEKVLLLGVLLSFIGVALTIYAIVIWKSKSWGELDPTDVMPITIPAVYLIIIGIQAVFTSFIIGILNIEYKKIEK